MERHPEAARRADGQLGPTDVDAGRDPDRDRGQEERPGGRAPPLAPTGDGVRTSEGDRGHADRPAADPALEHPADVERQEGRHQHGREDGRGEHQPAHPVRSAVPPVVRRPAEEAAHDHAGREHPQEGPGPRRGRAVPDHHLGHEAAEPRSPGEPRQRTERDPAAGPDRRGQGAAEDHARDPEQQHEREAEQRDPQSAGRAERGGQLAHPEHRQEAERGDDGEQHPWPGATGAGQCGAHGRRGQDHDQRAASGPVPEQGAEDRGV